MNIIKVASHLAFWFKIFVSFGQVSQQFQSNLIEIDFYKYFESGVILTQLYYYMNVYFISPTFFIWPLYTIKTHKNFKKLLYLLTITWHNKTIRQISPYWIWVFVLDSTTAFHRRRIWTQAMIKYLLQWYFNLSPS